MQSPVLLITPPFTQLNTPYPATAYLSGFLKEKGILSFQADLGIETFLSIFSQKGLTSIFENPDITKSSAQLNDNVLFISENKQAYINSIDLVIAFLQGKQPGMAYPIAGGKLLPQAARFKQLANRDAAFGRMGIHDKAKYLATMYLEDLGDYIKAVVDDAFGFSRYHERIARSAYKFDEIEQVLQLSPSFIVREMFALLGELLSRHHPDIVCFSVPFPGNLLMALHCGRYIKTHYPTIKTIMGGGFVNTELRQINSPSFFNYIDFLTLDDGEAPLECLIGFIRGFKPISVLKRTFLCVKGDVQYHDNTLVKDYQQGNVGTPTFEHLPLDQYVSVVELLNPMQSLWSNGLWNKLTMAHGCYWAKCTFCDVSLDYIGRYEPLTAKNLCDKMEKQIAETGNIAFHFVDEAAPPALMKALSIELIQRNLLVIWWANIRFEKGFSRDLCLLLKRAGCIAVSGGLEVASDRLLKLINKGVTVEQVAKVADNFTQAGIMVHAYLMYGYPTQTALETIDSLEMVRQMFECNLIQSAFWHRFALTVHSPIYQQPELYGILLKHNQVHPFANNDAEYEEINGCDHDIFSYGLEKSLINYMHGMFLELPVNKWFEQKVPKTSIAPGYIKQILSNQELHSIKPTQQLLYIGNKPTVTYLERKKREASWEEAQFKFVTLEEIISVSIPAKEGRWLERLIGLLLDQKKSMLMSDVIESYMEAGLEDIELFFENKPVNQLWKIGLLRF